jgi:crossover junction endodeoxyribonuclease RusA
MRPPLEFFAAGLPKAQPRVKARACGKFAQVYTPKCADDWKMIVRYQANEAWQQSMYGPTPWEGPLRVDLTFYFPRPKSHFRSNGELKPTAPLWHTTKPDRDNSDKAVLDALTNLGIWHDDKQVCDGRIVKQYAAIPGCQIRISEARTKEMDSQDLAYFREKDFLDRYEALAVPRPPPGHRERNGNDTDIN